jgi:hypothetical protein
MAESVEIKRKIYGKNSFSNVVDTKFTQLVPQDGNPEETNTPQANVESFFNDYDTLFYDIPPSGSENSHETIVKKSSEYIGINIDDMEEEIKNLREENVSLKNQLLLTITNPK